MRILVVGATGVIGREVVNALSARHEVVQASAKSTPLTVDIASVASIQAMYAQVGKVDAVISCTGFARFNSLTALSDDDFQFSLGHKLMGQVNLVRHGLDSVRDNGSFTLTSGILARKPMKGSVAIGMVNAGLEGFMRGAAFEAPRGIRVNVVSPPWVTETLAMLKMDTSIGMSSADVARAYVRSATGSETGLVIDP